MSLLDRLLNRLGKRFKESATNRPDVGASFASEDKDVVLLLNNDSILIGRAVAAHDEGSFVPWDKNNPAQSCFGELSLIMLEGFFVGKYLVADDVQFGDLFEDPLEIFCIEVDVP
jgi:hypothetical protein